MTADKKPSEFMAVLDYILNRSSIREIDALETAVERRRRDLAATSGVISLDPERAARSMSETVRTSINKSMDGIRNTFREFAIKTIQKEAPELTEEQMRELVDSWIPEDMSVDAAGKVASSSGDLDGIPIERSRGVERGPGQYVGLAKKGRINGIPCDAMYEMICQFVSYSAGNMPLADEAALREQVGDWTSIYWKKFPSEIKALIKEFLGGSLTGAEFDTELSGMLQ
jgi:hypothetical protein